MSEHVVMPRSDWQDILNAVREKAGKTDLIKSGELAAIVRALGGGGSVAIIPIATGTVVPAQDYYGDENESLNIIHNLGITPNFYIFIHNGDDTLPSDATRGSIVIDVGNYYLQGEWIYSKGYGTTLAYYTYANYDVERNALFFVPYVNPTADRCIVAGEEYIWICGVLGEPFGELITFTIDGTTYQANEGMTWSDWVYSNYNTDGFALYDAGDGYWEIHSASGASVVYGDRPYYTQYASDEVYAGYTYRTA